MGHITKLSLKRPVSTLLIVLAIVVFGVQAIMTMPLEQMSDIDMPMQIVLFIYPGADAVNVEKLVTRPVEDTCETLSGVSGLTSRSSDNMSMVLVTYEYGTDIDEAYSKLKEALDTLKHSLPDTVQTPRIIQMDLDAVDTMTISARSTGGADVLKYVEDTVQPELESLSGVARVEVSGGAKDYISVKLNEEKLSQYGMTISSIAQLVAAADFSIPAGTVSNGSNDVSVTAYSSLDDLESIRNIALLTGTGSLVHLSDVAEVTMGEEKATSVSRYNGHESISIGVTKKQTAGTTKVCRDVEKELERLKAEGVEFRVIYTAAESIENTIKQVFETLLIGVACTMFVLLVFIGDIRACLIVGSSMPLSVLLTICIIHAIGYSLNIMTGGALILAIGMIVDNSIVVLESCFRMKEENLDYAQAAHRGAATVGTSVLASTITTVVVYLPISVMKGLSGQIFQQLGFTIIFTMLASLISAVTIVPLAFSWVKPVAKEELPINKLLRLFNRKYDGWARAAIRHRVLTMLIAVVMLGVSVFAAYGLHKELIPAFYDGSISISVDFRSGTKLQRMDEMIQPIEEMLLADENFRAVNVSVSDSSASLTAYAVDDCKRSSGDAVTEYTERLHDLTNMDITITPSGSISGMGSLTSFGVEIDLEGNDLDALKDGAAMVQEAMTKIPGVIKVDNDFAQSRTAAKIVVDPLRAMSVGLTPAGVSQNIYMTLSGVDAKDVTIDGEDYTITLEYPEGRYDNIASLLDQPIATPYGGYIITLGEIADVTYTSDLQTIARQDGKYQIGITATTTTAAAHTAQDAIYAAVDELNLPRGVQQSEAMMVEMMDEELSGLLNAIFTAVFLVFLVMAMQFESVRFSLMVMTCIPFSLVGSFLLMYFTGTTLSIISMMGFLMLMGIVVNNGILLVDTTNQMLADRDVEDALVAAGQLRLRPILMTTLTTVLSMVPMLLQTDPTMRLMESLAMVIIGGLVASTVMAMFMMPAFYMLLSKKQKRVSLGVKKALPAAEE